MAVAEKEKVKITAITMKDRIDHAGVGGMIGLVAGIPSVAIMGIISGNGDMGSTAISMGLIVAAGAIWGARSKN